MKRIPLLAAWAALPLALAGCPLPQPLAEVARTVDGGTVSTPIILSETAVPAGSTIFVSTGCTTPPGAQFTLSATVEDVNTDEAVEARWFVNWRAESPGLIQDTSVSASTDANDPLRPIPPIVFQPYGFGTPPTSPLHVVEVVVSNNFLLTTDPTPPFQRAAPPPFETQVYRWVFQYVDPSDTRGRCQ